MRLYGVQCRVPIRFDHAAKMIDHPSNCRKFPSNRSARMDRYQLAALREFADQFSNWINRIFKAVLCTVLGAHRILLSDRAIEMTASATHPVVLH